MKAFWAQLTRDEMKFGKAGTCLVAVATWVTVFVSYHTFVSP